MLISLVGTLAQIKMGVGCITFHGMWPRMSQYAFLTSESRFVMHFRTLNFILGCSASYFLEMIMPVGRKPDSNKIGDW